jgi:hypothetical protein
MKANGASACVRTRTRRYDRRTRIRLCYGFKALGFRLLQLEFGVRQFAHAWLSLPRLECGLRVINIRTYEGIFDCCQRGDLQGVRRWIESSAATVDDMSWHYGSLLTVSCLGWCLARNAVGSNFLKRIQAALDGYGRQFPVIKYLLLHGADPNWAGNSTESPLETSLRRGRVDYARVLLEHGADHDVNRSFVDILGESISYLLQFRPRRQILSESERQSAPNMAEFMPEIAGLLAQLGLNDLRPYEKLLTMAASIGHIPTVLYSFNKLDRNPNIIMRHEGRWATPFSVAIRSGNVKAAEILLGLGSDPEYQLDRLAVVDAVQDYTGRQASIRPLHLAICDYGWSLHYALSVGGNFDPIRPDLNGSGVSLWPVPKERFMFPDLELQLTHLLFHNYDPFIDTWFTPRGCTGCPSGVHHGDAAYIMRSWNHDNHSCRDHDSLYAQIFVKPVAEWDDLGCVAHAKNASVPKQTPRFRPEGPFGSDLSHQYDTIRKQGLPFPTFQRAVSSPESRDRLTRFPAVVALCGALWAAGYRAEMDDDGDIWYEAEDGERYSDAQEHQPCDLGDAVGDDCHICLEPERFGLDWIWTEAAEAREQLRDGIRDYEAKLEWKRRNAGPPSLGKYYM